jgi:hypothetical protein
MRLMNAAAAIAAALLACAGVQAAGTQGDRLPMPCLQLVPPATMRTAAGERFTLKTAALSRDGDSVCTWEDTAEPPGRIAIAFTDRRGFPAAAPTAAGAFDAYLAAMKRQGLTPEAVAGVGEAGVLFPLGDSLILAVRRADGVVRITATRVARDRALSIARGAAAAPSPALGVHQRIPEPEPVTASTPLALTPEQRRLPCVRLLTAADFTALGRKDVLVEVLNPRPGFSSCTWRATSDESGVALAVATAQEFADNKMADAAAYFAFERQLHDGIGGTEPLSGLGLEAFAARPVPIVVVRRTDDVLKLSCLDPACTRDAVLALLRRVVTR